MKIPVLNTLVKRIFQIVTCLVCIILSYIGFVPDQTEDVVDIINIDSFRNVVMQRELDSVLQVFVDSAYAPQKEGISGYFNKLHKWSGFNGNVLFAVQGKVVYQGTFGYRDLNKKDSLTITDAFQLASVSKTITSTAVMQLVERGLVDLSADFRTYIPEFPEKYSGITIDYLLSHKSGLFEYYYFNDKAWRKRKDYLNFEELLRAIQDKTPNQNYLPGRKYNYNNLNYVILAEIVERVSKQSFDTYLKEHIFVPAGMKDAFVFSANDSVSIAKKKVYGHYYGYRKYILEYSDGLYGDKGIFASVGDLLAFDQALGNNILLRKETYDLATSPKHQKLHTYDNYGYGWRIDASENKSKVVYHGGWWKGFRTQFIRVGDNEATIIMLSNRLKASRRSRKSMIKLLLSKS